MKLRNARWMELTVIAPPWSVLLTNLRAGATRRIRADTQIQTMAVDSRVGIRVGPTAASEYR